MYILSFVRLRTELTVAPLYIGWLVYPEWQQLLHTIIKWYCLLTFEGKCTYGTHPHIKGHAHWYQIWIIKTHFSLFTMILLDITLYIYIYIYIYIWLYKLLPQHHLIQHLDYIMNATDYWLFVREYSIWNTIVATSQVWTADLDHNILSSAIEVYANFPLYYLHTLATQPTWRSFIWLLHDHTKWCFWERTCPSRWRIWEWKQNF